ncbi:ankyrin repeat domain-containing protein [Pelagibius sp.]|uniref:ankyrin repeat domain-containing protein n=1 Tax=Pelagibius sp. TaxID=1931238 RepID=UPI00260E73C7|nr:ankyrin repeat domain-containing protein [Pelagibius sp.]
MVLAALPWPARAGGPLIAATLDGDGAKLELLLNAGADPNCHDAQRNTALIYAARDGRLAFARRLIEAGADVDWVDGEGVTPLILAAFKGHEDLAALLLRHGARSGLRDQWGPQRAGLCPAPRAGRSNCSDAADRRGMNEDVTGTGRGST